MNANYLSKVKSFVILLLTFAAFAACSPQDDLPEMMQEGDALKINISMAGFASDNPETRIYESGYVTTFTPDDEIGITVLSNRNEILQNNVAYKYTGSTWTPAGSEKISNYYGATYIAYYPYSAAMDGKKTTAEILAAFAPKTDQSTYSSYTASDLMTGEGTVSDATLNISFAHAFTLVEAKLSAKYILQGTSYIYKNAPLLDLAFSVNSGQVMFYPANDSVFRYIVKSGSTPITVSGTNNGLSWSKQFTPQAGEYKRLNVDDKIIVTPPATFAVGDYYPIPNDRFSAMGVVYETSNNGANGTMVSIEEVQSVFGKKLDKDSDKNNGANNSDLIKDRPVFELAKAKNGGATTPWYIPAANELRSFMRSAQIDDIKSKAGAAHGGQGFPSDMMTPYWTSTQEDGKIYFCSLWGNTALYTDAFTLTYCPVRAFRKF